MDGKGNINVNAAETMNLNAKNMTITVTENLTTTVGKNEFKNVEMMQTTTVGKDAEIFVAGTLTETIEGDVISETKKDREEISRSTMNFASAQSINKHANKTITTNSGEKGINT